MDSGVSFVKQALKINEKWFCLIEIEQAKIFSKEEEKTTKKKKKVLFIAGRGKNARLFRFFYKKVDWN